MCFISAGLAAAGLLGAGIGVAISSFAGQDKPEAPKPVQAPKEYEGEAKSYNNRNRLNEARRRATQRPDILTSPLGLIGSPQQQTPSTGQTTLGV